MAVYKYLFTPLKLGPITLKNRIVCSGHSNKTQDPVTHMVTDRMKAYYEEKARGGAALIVSPVSSVDERADGNPAGGLAFWTDDVIPGLKEMVDIIHKHDCKFFAEPFHPGPSSGCHWLVDEVPMAASQIPIIQQPYVIPLALTKEEIWEIEDKFPPAVERLVKAGVDGIEFVHGHGKLTWEFASPVTNKRDDEYGGSFENRQRFTLEILEKIRQVVGKNFPIGLRINVIDMDPPPYAMNVDELVELAKMMEETGYVNYLSMVTGTFRSVHIEQNNYYADFEPGWAGEFSRKTKAAVKLPVAVSSKINDPGLAERMIAEGKCDYVYMARALIADPFFPKKAMEGREEDIRPCIYCNQGCFGRVYLLASGLRCSVNPAAGEEVRWGSWTFKKTPQRKKTLVVGAGPAGLQCALTLAERGHDVVIDDKENELGGQARLIKKLPSQAMPQTFIDYLDQQLQKVGVKVNLGVEITSKNIDEVLAKEKPDVAVIATGARPCRDGTSAFNGAPIPGWEGNNVYTYEDVILGTAKLGEKVLIVDDFGDRVSSGIAELLAKQGKKVEIITFRSYFGMNLTYWLDEPFMLPKLDELGVKLTPYTWVKQITGRGASCFHAFSGREFDIEADSIILVTTKYSNTELRDLFNERKVECHLIGDARAPRYIWNAVHDGYKLGREI